MLSRLAEGGFDQVLAVDLTMPELGIPVVCIVIPGAESMGGWLA
jgi:ribosomal protein S12 methylthiotransferase accessory factor